MLLKRPSLNAAARQLSRQLIGMVRTDHDNARLIVSHCRTVAPRSFLGWPVTQAADRPSEGET